MTEWKDTDLVIKDDGTKIYDCKGKTDLYIPCTWTEFSVGTVRTGNIPDFQGVKESGNTLYINIRMVVGQEDDKDIYQTVKLTFKDYNNIQKLWFKTSDESTTYQTNPEYYEHVISPLIKTNEERGTVTGSNFDDTVNLNGNNKIYTVNTKGGSDKITLSNTFVNPQKANLANKINAGAGINTIEVNGTGNNLITTGKDNDTFTFNQGTSTNTVKAGAGENTINITNANFGQITVTEEKVDATNKVVFSGENNNLEDYFLTKTGNDLTISKGESSLTINGYFATGKKLATTTVNEKNFEQLLNTTGKNMLVKGENKIVGTDYADNISSNDSVAGKPKNDKIYAGKGNDIINAGDGKNSIYVYEGDGKDTIENGGGIDTVIFQKGTSIDFGYVKTENQEDGNDIYNLKILYNNNDANDYVLLEDALVEKMGSYYLRENATSVTALKIGSKTYTLKSLFNRNKIENATEAGQVVGTAGDDDIYLTDKNKFKNNDEITVNGGKGSDNIMIGYNKLDEGAEGGHIIDNTNNYSYDPKDYTLMDIKPTVYTAMADGKQDPTRKVIDKVISYASNDGTYWAQSAINNIQVYGWHKDGNNLTTGTDDTYHVYYNRSFTKIADEAGTSDVLYVKDKKHTDLKLIFDLSKDYEDWATASADIDEITNENKDTVLGLIENSFQEVKLVTLADRKKFLKDPDKNSGIGIDIDYWCNKGLSSEDEEAYQKKADKLTALDMDTLKSFGSGVEKIVASDGYYTTSADIAQVASAVANWLNNDATYGGQFDSVEAVFSADNAQAAQNALLAVIDNNTVWHNV